MVEGKNQLLCVILDFHMCAMEYMQLPITIIKTERNDIRWWELSRDITGGAGHKKGIPWFMQKILDFIFFVV